MKIRINNRSYMFPDGCTLAKVVGERQLNKIIAMWVNGKPVLEEEYKTKVINDGDHIKVYRLTGEYDLVYELYGRKNFGMKHKEI